MAKRKKDKRTNNNLQNTTQKTKDRATRIPLKTADLHYEASYGVFYFRKSFEDTKGIIRRRKSKKNRQYNDQKEKG